MNWVSFFLGAAVGWLLEWLIDLFYWRRQSGELQVRLETSAASAREIDAKYQACRQQVEEAEAALEKARAKASALQAKLTEAQLAVHELATAQEALAASEAEVARLKAELEAVEAASADLSAQLAGESMASRGTELDIDVEPDDLTVIEGIGPKIAGILNSNGIHTFAQLANVSVEALQAALDQAGPRYRLADPGTWPEQAALAAAGDAEALQALQESLKGGREADEA